MKEKSKDKSPISNKEGSLQFPPLTLLETNPCPTYNSILQKNENLISKDELNCLQYELESCLISILERKNSLEEEIQILGNFQEKQSSLGKAQVSDCDKKNLPDDKPSKKQKRNEKTQPTMNSRFKAKYNQLLRFDSESSVEGIPKPSRCDALGRFWASLESYFTDLSQEHIKFLEEWVKIGSDDDDDDYFEIPPLKDHFSHYWNEKTVEEELKEGIKINEKKKGNIDDSTTDASKTILLTIDKKCDLGVNSSSLTQRLINSLVGEKIVPELEDTIDTAKEIPEFVSEKLNYSKASHNNNQLFVKRIMKDLELDVSFQQDGLDYDDLLEELKASQSSLKMIVAHNRLKKLKLLKLARSEIYKQDIRRKIHVLDSEVMDMLRKNPKKKNFPKKDREHVLQLLKNRGIYSKQLKRLHTH